MNHKNLPKSGTMVILDYVGIEYKGIIFSPYSIVPELGTRTIWRVPFLRHGDDEGNIKSLTVSKIKKCEEWYGN